MAELKHRPRRPRASASCARTWCRCAAFPGC